MSLFTFVLAFRYTLWLDTMQHSSIGVRYLAQPCFDLYVRASLAAAQPARPGAIFSAFVSMVGMFWLYYLADRWMMEGLANVFDQEYRHVAVLPWA
ncbi:hypothetical protein LTR53_012383 [Teratosphaeriaceae sp. CCFEE 6253]|nr:hypothetical protein LTR53_012383 [Teratosphaeriaceae sp. CCFEE 6253]